ncbi:MAG: glycosyltransferase family 2 protein [Oscillospiraceae bacterium]|nr:glycosyltransferase family 2 protein [Oscillospiraceae bacterium]
MILKIRRIKELFALFFEYVKTEGLAGTTKRAIGFFQRRMKAKKGRFLPPEDALERQKSYKCASIKDGTISIVTPLFNTDKKHLAEYVQSFLNQSYSYGQLCLADASDDAHSYVGEYIKSLNSDKIRYVKLEKNFGIAGNQQKAIDLASGEYICLCDHDDIISPDALYQMAKAIDDTNADFIYSDEALFDTDWTNPIVAHFKPDYSYYYLTNCNYICHLACIRKSVYEAVGGLNDDYNGAQDHDLFLKISEVEGVKIHHIPKVLYYWRVHAQSTSGGVDAKPYVTANAIRALDDHLARIGVKGKATTGKFGSTYKIDYEIGQEPLVSIIIPNKDHIDDLSKCLDSIYAKTTYKNFEIIVCENNSTEESTFECYNKVEKEHDNLHIVYYKGGFNFSAINNFAIKSAKGDMYLMLNNDIEIINGEWLSEMVSLAIQPNVGIVGAMLYYPDDTVQHAGVITGLGGFAGHSHKYHRRGKSGYMFRLSCVQNLSCVTAANLLVTKEAFEAANGLDEEFTVAFNDVDFCMRIRDMGWQVLFTPYAECYHYESKSRGSDKKGEKKERFEGERNRLQARHSATLLRDPFYNPNLTLDMEDFSESRVLPKYEQ